MDSIWAGGRILATSLEVERAQTILQLITAPVRVLPDRPDDQVRPFEIGLLEQLKALRKPGVSITALRRATSAYVHSKRYYLASGQPDAMRHSIDGTPTSAVSHDDQQIARRSLRSLEEAHAKPVSAAPSPQVDKTSRIKLGLLPRRRSALANRSQ
jgi:hypothetical protein